MNCLCRCDADGLIIEVCDQHRMNEWSAQRLLDAELDETVRELAGRSPTRIERKPGVTGDFAIARK
jgi:hypothetical protein